MAKAGQISEMTPTHDEIAAHAYEIYLREGCAAGRELDHWLRAEKELRADANGIAAASQHDARTAKSETAAILRNSVVPQTAPIEQVSRAVAPRRPTKREAVGAK